MDDVIEPVSTAMASTAVPPVDAPLRVAWLSPINQRRWQNFRANRRGYWSFWLFGALRALAVRGVHRQRPAVEDHIKGELLFPVFVDYPEEKFGGVLARDRLPRPFHAQGDRGERLDASGRRSATPTTPSTTTSRARARPPTWMLDEEQCKRERSAAAARAAGLEWNWLGTDDQARDVLARLIYGFRISVLFGLTLPISSVIGVAAGAVQGYFLAGWTDLLFQRFIEIWTSFLSSTCCSSSPRCSCQVSGAARHPAPVLLGGAGRRGARRVPARRGTSNT